jgi:hypothetical protein
MERNAASNPSGDSVDGSIPAGPQCRQHAPGLMNPRSFEMQALIAGLGIAEFAFHTVNNPQNKEQT